MRTRTPLKNRAADSYRLLKSPLFRGASGRCILVVSVQSQIWRGLRIGRDGGRLAKLSHRPEPGPGEVIVRPMRVACSRLDVDIWRGLFGFEGICGRSCTGVIESTGNDGTLGMVGRRVVVTPVITCGRCDMCRAGAPRHCRSRQILGMAGRDGCLADSVCVPTPNALAIPETLDDDAGAFALTAGTALHILRRAASTPRELVTVLGDGHLGHMVAQALAPTTPSVRVVGHYSEKLSLCEKWGIKHRHADDVGRRSDQHIVIDCTGSPDGLLLATEMVRPRGRIILPSLHRPEQYSPLRDQFTVAALAMKEVDLLGVGMGSLQEGLTILTRGELDVLSLISRRARLDDGASIFEAASQPGHITTLVSI